MVEIIALCYYFTSLTLPVESNISPLQSNTMLNSPLLFKTSLFIPCLEEYNYKPVELLKNILNQQNQEAK